MQKIRYGKEACAISSKIFCTYPITMKTPIHSKIISRTGNGKRDRFKGLKYQQVSI
jgi:hypothetical protein